MAHLRDVLPEVTTAASKLHTFEPSHMCIPRFSNRIRLSGEALKESSKNLEEHCISLKCSSDLLSDPRAIGDECCRNGLKDLQPLVKEIQIDEYGE